MVRPGHDDQKRAGQFSPAESVSGIVSMATSGIVPTHGALATRPASMGPIVAFVPWIIYWVIASGPSTWLFGAFAAAVTAAIVAVPASRRLTDVRPFDILTVVFFVAVAIVGVCVGARDGDWMDTYSTTVAAGVLALAAFGSLGWVPLTEQYSGDSRAAGAVRVPRRAHRRATIVWGVVFAAISVLGLVSVRWPASDDWTVWVIPLVLIVAAARFTPRLTRMDAATHQNAFEVVVAWLRRGYPHGVPSTDYVPLVALLKRSLSDEDLMRAVQAVMSTSDTDAVTADEIRSAIRQVTTSEPNPEEIHQVAARLAVAGWPLAMPVD